MNKLLYGCMAILFAAGLSCKEIFEPSLNKETVQLLAPGNQYQTTDSEIGFWFEPVEDALSYRLQVVNPAFDSIGSLVLDTLIQSNKFFFVINPGEYQWRVQAQNESSKTPFSEPWTFKVNPVN